MSTGVTAINEEVQRASAFVQPLFAELNKVIIGQRYLLERLCIGLLANGEITPVIDNVFPLSEIADAHRRAESRESFGKVVVTC